MSSADILEGVALTDTESTRAADELAHFKKVLKHHENILFSDSKYLMNKSRQERLRLPTRIPAEEDIQKQRNFTVSAISELSHCDGFDLLSFVHLQNIVCSRLTLFNARRGGEPSRMSIGQWSNRHQWLNVDTVAALSDEERTLFDDMQMTYMTGKGNHVVPCLIPRDCVHAMDLLWSPDVRRAVHVDDNNKHIFV